MLLICKLLLLSDAVWIAALQGFFQLLEWIIPASILKDQSQPCALPWFHASTARQRFGAPPCTYHQVGWVRGVQGSGLVVFLIRISGNGCAVHPPSSATRMCLITMYVCRTTIRLAGGVRRWRRRTAHTAPYITQMLLYLLLFYVSLALQNHYQIGWWVIHWQYKTAPAAPYISPCRYIFTVCHVTLCLVTMCAFRTTTRLAGGVRRWQFKTAPIGQWPQGTAGWQ